MINLYGLWELAQPWPSNYLAYDHSIIFKNDNVVISYQASQISKDIIFHHKNPLPPTLALSQLYPSSLTASRYIFFESREPALTLHWLFFTIQTRSRSSSFSTSILASSSSQTIFHLSPSMTTSASGPISHRKPKVVLAPSPAALPPRAVNAASPIFSLMIPASLLIRAAVCLSNPTPPIRRPTSSNTSTPSPSPISSINTRGSSSTYGLA